MDETIEHREKRSRAGSGSVMLGLALFAIIEFALLGTLVAREGNLAQTVEIAGSERVRTERLTYLSMRRDSSTPQRRAQIEREIADIQSVQAGLYSYGKGDPKLAGSIARYVAAARALSRDPADRVDRAAVVALEPALLKGFEAALRVRADRSARVENALGFLVVGGAALLLLAIYCGWRFAIAPEERRLAERLAEVNDRRREIHSVFYENPDPAAIFDLDGRMQRVNRARERLLDWPSSEATGQHFTAFVSGPSTEATIAAFARARRGESFEFETRLRSRDGESIDVRTNLFPHVVDGRLAGVVAVSKDVRELRRAQALSTQQSRRMARLYGIASKNGTSLAEQLEKTLEFARKELGYAWAGAYEIRADGIDAVATVGEESDLAAIAPHSLGEALAAQVMAADDVWELENVEDSPWGSGAYDLPYKSFVAMPVRVQGAKFGAVALAGRAARRAPLPHADLQFVRLVSSLIASTLERIQQERKLDALAHFDTLTGLPNRILLRHKLDELVAAQGPQDTRFAVHFIDLDRFKEINDQAGHAAGDEALRGAATRMLSCVSETDLVARIAGDEFIVVQPITDAGPSAVDLSERLLMAMERPFWIEDVPFHLTVSVGVSLFPEDGRDAETLLARADEALYRAKRQGRNQTTFASSA